MNNKHTYIGKSFTESYLSLIQFLLNQGITKAPRGQNISHLQNCYFEVENPSTVFSCDSRPYQWNYLNKELNLYFEGKRSAKDFSQASKFWMQLANSDGNINSSYGYRIFFRPIQTEVKSLTPFKNQWDYAKYQLEHDKDTRQALIFVSGSDVQFAENKDFICTLTYLFDICDNKLNITVNRRSQDLFFGIPYDFAWEYILLCKMHKELVATYPNLEIGSYAMFCNNIHIYERNFDTFKNMLNDYQNNNYKNLSIMENIDPSIIENYLK